MSAVSPSDPDREEPQLWDVLQLMTVARRSGTLQVWWRERRGQIVLVGGDIVHAATGELAGEEAFYTITAWLGAQLRFEAGTPKPVRTIERDAAELLREASRRLGAAAAGAEAE